MDADNEFTFRRYGKIGPIIARSKLCPERQGRTEIHFTKEKLTVVLTQALEFPPLHSTTRFVVNGKNYRWEHQQLVEDESIAVLATFYEMLRGEHEGKLGQLVITPAGIKMRDLVVVTLFIVQERIDESRAAVLFQSIAVS